MSRPTDSDLVRTARLVSESLSTTPALAEQLEAARKATDKPYRLRELQPRPRDQKSAAQHDFHVAGQRRLARAGYGDVIAAFEHSRIDFGPMFLGFDDPRELAKRDPTTLSAAQLTQLIAFATELERQVAHDDR